MGRVRLLTRILLQQGADLPDAVAALNRFCAEEDLVATVLAVAVDIESMVMTAVTAGHPPPVVRRIDHNPVEPGGKRRLEFKFIHSCINFYKNLLRTILCFFIVRADIHKVTDFVGKKQRGQ